MNRLLLAISHRARLLLPVIALLSIILGALPANVAHADTNGPVLAKKMVGYFSNWSVYGRNYWLKDIHTSGNADRLTHLNYAFADVRPDSGTTGQVKCKVYDPWADYVQVVPAVHSVNGIEITPTATLRGNFQQLRELKKIYPDLKVMISIGGWSLSSFFSDMAINGTSRAAFVDSCIDLFLKGNLPVDSSGNPAGGTGAAAGLFDGIDIDWEFPGVCGWACDPPGPSGKDGGGRPKPNGCLNGGTSICAARSTDGANFTALMTAFRSRMNTLTQQTGKPYLLTAATSVDPVTVGKLQLAQLHPQLDYINVMAYDIHGPFEAIGKPSVPADFNAPLYPSTGEAVDQRAKAISEAMKKYLFVGTTTTPLVPAWKLVLGVPYYGRAFKIVDTAAGSGLYQQASSASVPGTYQANIEAYRALKGKYRAGQYYKYFDTVVKNAYLYNPTTKVFWSYDDVETMQAKAQYINDKQLGGVMLWEMNGDSVTGELTQALYDALN